MAKEVLTFDSLAQVDYGSVKVAMDEALLAAYRDMLDRPGVKEDRKVNLEIKMKPHPDSSGPDLGYVVTSFAIKKSFPAKGTVQPMAASPSGLSFQTDAPDNPDQSTLFTDGEDE